MFLKLNSEKIRVIIFLLVFALVIAPALLFAQPSRIVACDGVDCDYGALIQTLENLLQFLVYFAGFVAVIMFVWAGAKLVLSGGNPSAKEEAKKIIRSTVIGFIFVLTAWLIVEVILSTFGASGTPIG